ncbi:MAG: hypothetical protein H6624_05065 [Bdellovibrionaceae bacterium]|nr:hypothetical protein [Bdellovibrionales bacterium]MCB9083689.1 hypothetical protein [Pseudobdellovibrionaceae bacterium]
MKKIGILLAITAGAFSAQAQVEQFHGTYNLQQGDRSCSEVLLVEACNAHFADQQPCLWYTKQNRAGHFRGNGVLANLKQMGTLEIEECPTAGPVIPGCKVWKTQQSLLNSDSVLSRVTSTTRHWGVTVSRQIKTVRMVKKGDDQLVFEESNKNFKGWVAESAKSQTCNYSK